MKKNRSLLLGALVLSLLTPAFGQSEPKTEVGAQESPPLVVVIDEKGNLRFGTNARPVTIEHLRDELVAAASKGGEVKMAISASNTFQKQLTRIVEGAVANRPGLTRFSLNFSGGTPAQLVEAIEHAMGKPLNVIIAPEDAETQLPPLKINEAVTAPQLFAALAEVSHRIVVVEGQQFATDYGFNTRDSPATDSSIWLFHANKPYLPPLNASAKVCKFYSLAQFLERGFTVDDITTAIQTGWKISGIRPAPELKYHSETKLLIAYAEPNELATIQSVLDSLPAPKATSTELKTMRSDIASLQQQIKELKIKVGGLGGPMLEEKSGK